MSSLPENNAEGDTLDNVGDSEGGFGRLFSELPLELWHEVLSKLSASFDGTTLQNLALSSKSWNALATPYLYRNVSILDRSMTRQILFLQTLQTRHLALVPADSEQSHPALCVRSLRVGICPTNSDDRGVAFTYELVGVLSAMKNLACLELARTENTETKEYSFVSRTLGLPSALTNNVLLASMRRRRYFSRGDISGDTTPPGLLDSEDPTVYPQLDELHINIPLNHTLCTLLSAQSSLRALSLLHPSHLQQPSAIFRSPNLVRLALSGEYILTHIPESLAPTHLRVDCPSSTSLWPSRFRKTKVCYLTMPDTSQLRGLEISSTLMEELQLCITGESTPLKSLYPPSEGDDAHTPSKSEREYPLRFPALKHLGIFMSQGVDVERFTQERRFLLMWSPNGAARTSGDRNLNAATRLLRWFPELETLSVACEGVGDWMDDLVEGSSPSTSSADENRFEFVETLQRECCPRLNRVLWRRRLPEDAPAGSAASSGMFALRVVEDARWVEGPMAEKEIADCWAYA